MTALHKKFEEKKAEEIKRVEERFEALLKKGDEDYTEDKHVEAPQK
jgi:hypothetical protein